MRLGLGIAVGLVVAGCGGGDRVTVEERMLVVPIDAGSGDAGALDAASGIDADATPDAADAREDLGGEGDAEDGAADADADAAPDASADAAADVIDAGPHPVQCETSKGVVYTCGDGGDFSAIRWNEWDGSDHVKTCLPDGAGDTGCEPGTVCEISLSWGGATSGHCL